MRRRDAGDLRGAIELLRVRLQEAPEDGTVLRLLAQTLYWAKEPVVARALYERGLTLHPEDLQLRVDYGRMLVETGDAGRARALLEPLETTPQASQAHTLLGTLAYWRGDWNTAVRHFRAAVAADAQALQAREQWRAIAGITAPWTRAGVEITRDNQPLRTFGPSLEAGRYLAPLWSMGLRVGGTGLSSPGVTSSTWQHLEAFTAATLVPLRLRLDATGGTLRRDGASELTGRASARIRVAGPVSIGGRVERRPYGHTIASINTPVVVEEGAALVALESATGWVGEAAISRQRYPDDNAIHVAYAWMLAPLVRRPAGSLQLGYAVSREDAEELRFVLANPAPGVPAGNPALDLSGRYVPYYTPDGLVAHAAIGAISLRAGAATSFFVDGMYAVRATDRAPVWIVAGAPPAVTLASYERSLHPARVSARWQQQLGADVTLEASASYLRTIYYASRRAGMSLTWRGSSAAMRRVDRQ